MRQRHHVAVARPVERVAQVGAEPLDRGQRAVGPLLDSWPPRTTSPIVRSRKYWASAVISATSWKWKLTLTVFVGSPAHFACGIAAHLGRHAHVRSGLGLSRPIRPRIAANNARGTATSASWNDVAAVAHDPGPDLDQLLAQRRQRPLLDLLRQGQRPQEVGQVVGQGEQLQPHLVVPERRHDSRVQLSAFLPSLIHCSAVPRPL